MGMFDLTGRLAVVTGCRRGIGLAMAEALAGAGADIVGVSRQLEAEASEVQQRVEATGRTFAGHCVDFADRDAVQRVRVGARLGWTRSRHSRQQRWDDRPLSGGRSHR